MSAALPGRRKFSMEESNRKLNKATDDNQRYRGNATVCADSKTSAVGKILEDDEKFNNEKIHAARRKFLKLVLLLKTQSPRAARL